MIEADDRQNARLHDLQHQNAHAHQEETREELHLLCHRRLASKLNTAHTMAHRVPPASERRIRHTADAAFSRSRLSAQQRPSRSPLASRLLGMPLSTRHDDYARLMSAFGIEQTQRPCIPRLPVSLETGG